MVEVTGVAPLRPEQPGVPTIISEVTPSSLTTCPEHSLLLRERNSVRNNPQKFQYISSKMQICTVYLYLKTTLRVSGGTSTHHQERTQLYLQHLVFVRPLLLPAAIAAKLHVLFYLETALHVSGGTTTTVVCSPDNEWWYHPKHVEQFPDKINCVTLLLVGYILE